MDIAIIGAGNVGAALATGWIRAGHRVVLGVTDPAAAKNVDTSRRAGGAALATLAGAASQAAVVVVAVPWPAVASALAACGDLAGRVVIDVTNPLVMGADGLGLECGFDTSGAERIARLVPGASVFKAMNQVGATVMDTAGQYATAPVMFVAGDDDARKPEVMGLIADLGFDARDAGGLSVARLLEPFAMLWIHMALKHGMPTDSAFALVRRPAAAGAPSP